MSDYRFFIRYSSNRAERHSQERAEEARLSGFKKLAIDGIDVHVSSGTPTVLLDGGRGCVIGTLIRNGDRRVMSEPIDVREAGQIVAEQGLRLSRAYWGSYLAVLLDKERQRVWIVRDPSGTLPCYKIDLSGNVMLASDMELFARLGGVALRVDWDNLARFLYAPTPRRKETCVENISEVQPGFATPLHDTAAISLPVWDPWEHTRPPADPATAAEELESVIRCSTAALSEPHDHVVVAVSGGLDSSIVAAALKLEGRNFTCFTIATEERSGDERPYAQMVADHLGVRLIDRIYQPDQVSVLTSSASHLPRPLGKYFMQEMQRGLVAAGNDVGASATFTGNGGDNVFCYLHSVRPILDRIYVEGWTSGVWRSMLDMCRITGADIFSMARLVARGLFKPAKAYHWTGDSALLAGKFGPAAFRNQLEPHLEGRPGGPLGKAQHIAMLMRIKNFVEGYDRAISTPTIAPLISQPVVEFCLRVPTWEWAKGGVNRALARSAFSGHLPAKIIARTSKSGPDSFTAHVFNRNRQVLRSMLLDGLLVENGVVDHEAVETAFEQQSIVQSQAHHRVLMLAEAEAWARSFRNPGPTT